MSGMNYTTDLTSQSDADPNAVSIEQANERIHERLPMVSGTEYLPLHQCRGRYLNSALLSPMSSPPFRASAMDGFAFRAADGGDTRSVVGESFAGHPCSDILLPGECVRVTTGARVPNDADMVVQQENTSLSKTTLSIEKLPEALGHHIRGVGSDCQQGQCIAQAGTRINAGLIGLCSALGIDALEVKRKVRITLISTGDELKSPGDVLSSGQIYDSNTALLTALLDNPNFDVSVGARMQDNPASVNHALDQAISVSDVVITTGGVSVGEKDYLREVVDARGGVALWKVAMKPGRPLSFGVIDDKTPWFGLPGNPVSAALTTLLFVLPAIKHSLGLKQSPMRTLQARCSDNLKKLPGRVEFQRGYLSSLDNGEIVVSTTGLQDSHVLSSLANANCFIRLAMESSGANPGDLVTVIPYEFAQHTLA